MNISFVETENIASRERVLGSCLLFSQRQMAQKIKEYE